MRNVCIGNRIGRGRRGFTLIEIIVVLAVMGILALASIPLAGNWLQRYRTNAAAQELAMLMQRARVFAVSRSQRARVVFFQNEDPQRAVIESLEAGVGWAPVPQDARVQVILPRRTQIQGVASDFVAYFDRNGTIVSDAGYQSPIAVNTTLQVVDYKGYTAEITMSPSGKIVYRKAKVS